MRDKRNIRKIDIIIRMIFTSIMILNLLTQVLVLIGLIRLGYYSFQSLVMFIFQVIVFAIFLLYYFIFLILNYFLKIRISKRVFLFSFFINVAILLLTFVLIFI